MFWPKTDKSGVKCVIEVHPIVLIVIIDFIAMGIDMVLVDHKIRPDTIVQC